MPPHEVLAIARAAAARDGQRDLCAAIHAVLVLDLTGGPEALAPVIAAARELLDSRPGDDPGAVN